MYDLYIYFLGFLIAIIASIIGTISGGGALIAFPFLLLIGLEPKVAIATIIVSTIGLALGALPNFIKGKKIIWNKTLPLTIIGILGAVIGSNLLIGLNEKLFSKIIGIILIFLFGIFCLGNEFGIKTKQKSKTKKTTGYGVYFLLAIYSSFFGAASGTLIIYCLVYFFGMTFIQANATDLFALLFISFTSFLVFSYNGILDYSILSVFLLGTIVGGYFGSLIAIKKGDKWVKKFILVIIALTIIKLFFYN